MNETTFISDAFSIGTPKDYMLRRVLSVKSPIVEFYDIVDPEVIDQVFEGVLRNKHILYVDLSYNKLGDKWGSWMARLIREKKELVSLNLCRTGLTTTTLQILLPALQENNTLQRIMLGWNILNQQDVLFIIEGLRRVPRLVDKSLREVCFDTRLHPDEKDQVDAAVKELASVNPYFCHIYMWQSLGVFTHSFFLGYRQKMNQTKLLLLLPVCPLEPSSRFVVEKLFSTTWLET